MYTYGIELLVFDEITWFQPLDCFAPLPFVFAMKALWKELPMFCMPITDVVDHRQPFCCDDVTIAIHSWRSTPIEMVDDASDPFTNQCTIPLLRQSNQFFLQACIVEVICQTLTQSYSVQTSVFVFQCVYYGCHVHTFCYVPHIKHMFSSRHFCPHPLSNGPVPICN